MSADPYPAKRRSSARHFFQKDSVDNGKALIARTKSMFGFGGGLREFRSAYRQRAAFQTMRGGFPCVAFIRSFQRIYGNQKLSAKLLHQGCHLYRVAACDVMKRCG